MSTRSTYKISNKFFYIHSDGYLSGAAYYFYNMLCCKNQRGGFAEQFLRANDKAEFTESHNIHGDTEFRYDLDQNLHLTAWQYLYSLEKWEVVYSGNLYDFVNEYNDKKFKSVSVRGYKSMFNEQTAANWLLKEFSPLKSLSVWAKNKTMTAKAANWEYSFNEVLAIVEAFPAVCDNTEISTMFNEVIQYNLNNQ